MKRIRTVEAPAFVGEIVYLQGWLQNVRVMGGVSFLVLRDGWGTIQAVTENEADLRPLVGCGPETILSISGLVVASDQARDGVELHNPQIEVIEAVTASLPAPLHKRRLNSNLPALLDHATVLNRHPSRRAVFHLASVAMAAFREYLSGQQFTEIQSPKIVESATEGGANVFTIDYFGRTAYLAQSPQFYKQIMVGVFERVFEVGPVFRAEPHDTTRHVNEYVSLDVEFGFIEDHFTVMALLRDLMATMMERLAEQGTAELLLLEVETPRIPDEIPHIHFTEARQLLLSLTGEDNSDHPDLTPAEERRLGAWAREEFNSDFLFVTGYPMVKRPFYTHPDPKQPAYSNSFDLLFRGLELVTGGQRLHRYEDYLAALRQSGLDNEPFAAYLETFRYGMPPHGGFAIGLERLLMQLLDLPNLRLATLFPRDLKRVSP